MIASAGNPFQQIKLPPPPPAINQGLRDRLARLFGSTLATAQANFNQACQLFNAGSFDAALTLFAQINFSRLPDALQTELRARLYQAFCAAYLGRYDQALPLIEYVCNYQPQNATALYLRGRLQYLLGQHSAARDSFARAGQMRHVHIAAREAVADLLRAGRFDEALPLLEYLRGQSPLLATWIGHIHVARAHHYYHAAQFDAALVECEAAGRAGNASPALTQVCGLASLANLSYAITAMNLGQARQYLNTARQNLGARFAPRIDQLSVAVEQSAYLMAFARVCAKDYAAAISFLQRIVTSPHAPPHAPILYALALFWNGDAANALQTLTNAPEATQKISATQYLAGYLASRLNRAEEAYRWLQPVYCDHPDFPGALKALACVSYAEGFRLLDTDTIRAGEMLQFARQAQPVPQTERAAATAFCIAGARALEQKRYAQASDLLAHARAIEPALSQTRIYAGLACLGQAAEALRAKNLVAAIQQTEQCLTFWLEDSTSNSACAVPDGAINRVRAFYAALLLRQAASDPQVSVAALERVRDYVRHIETPLASLLRGALAYFFDQDLAATVKALSATHAGGLTASEMSRVIAAACFGISDFAQAIPHYRTLLNDPALAHPLIAFYLAFCLWKTDAPAEAVQVIEPFARQPNAPDTLVFFYSFLLHLVGRAEDSATALDRLRSKTGTLPLAEISPAIMYAAGVELARAGKLDAASARLNESAAEPSHVALAVVEHLRAINAARENRFDAARTHVEQAIARDEHQRDATRAVFYLARYGQAVQCVNRGEAHAALDLLNEVESGLAQIQPDQNASWRALLALVRAAALLRDPGTASQAGELIEYAHASAFAPGAVLCGAYRWHIARDSAGAMTAWQAAQASPQCPPVVWRFLAMAHLRAERYAEAAQAYAEYRAITGEYFSFAAIFQAFCLLKLNRAADALALIPRSGILEGAPAFLRGYARFGTRVWRGARDDFARVATPRAQKFAALAACQVASGLIAHGNLAAADQELANALRLTNPDEIRNAIEHTQAKLKRQYGILFLKQGKFKEAFDLLSAASAMGLKDEGTQRVLAWARFRSSRAADALDEMRAAADTLKPLLPPPLAARILIETASQHLRAASATVVQLRGPAQAQAREAIQQKLEAAANLLSEGLRLDDAQANIHYLLGLLAYRLLNRFQLAFVHLQRAAALDPRLHVTLNQILGDLALKAGQVFLAKVTAFTTWRHNPNDGNARHALTQSLNREADLLRRFANGDKSEEPTATEETVDWEKRAAILNAIMGQMLGNVPPDRQSALRDLHRKLKQALADRHQTEFEKLEKELMTQIAPTLLR